MRLSALALAGLATATPTTLTARQSYSVDISGSYWDATITSQTGRPGYIIRDLNISFQNPKFEQTVGGTCHYSFVPQGFGAPAETDTCDAGLTYTWDCKFEHTLSYLLSVCFPLLEGARGCGDEHVVNAETDTTLTLTQKVEVENETLTLYGSAQIKNECKPDGAGSGSSCKGTARVELDHYCKLDGPVRGCYSPNGEV
ncbi:hypothetical protein BKA66DRAFT_470535 [Pyrenochaeta sp. MPI-SDFR-AT-0127]|nr:hypothetical protein BKA66DRAFT_470535 [Pyrenochaeta sp. MPI-SDFR-AT-0127]